MTPKVLPCPNCKKEIVGVNDKARKLWVFKCDCGLSGESFRHIVNARYSWNKKVSEKK